LEKKVSFPTIALKMGLNCGFDMIRALYFVCILCLLGCSSEQPIPEEGLSCDPCTVILVRHGETDWNAEGKSQGWRDIPLNEKGKAQARDLAKEFLHLPLKTIYSCSLSRAAETAKSIAEPHNASLILDPTLRFYRKNTIKTFFPITKKGKQKAMEKEIFMDATAYLKEIAKEHPGETVVVVTHKLVINTLQKEMGPKKSKAKKLANGRVISIRATRQSVALIDYDKALLLPN
jgi:broad specificity phosphatase PhoE